MIFIYLPDEPKKIVYLLEKLIFKCDKMRKIQLFVLLILGVCYISSAQNILTLEDVILKSRTKFAPKNLKQLQWQGEIDKYTFVRNDTLFQGNVEDNSIVSLLYISVLNIALKNYDSISRTRFGTGYRFG